MIQESTHAALDAWENFYLIVGSSAGALTGLQFVVITLISEGRNRTSTTPSGIDAFGTPTIVHFCAGLLVSVTLCAPWPSLSGAAVVVGAVGVAGLVYTVIVIARATRQTAYRMVVEDWIWHIILPAVAYGTLLVGATQMLRDTVVALFAIAASTLLLVYIGIHNAWDTSTFMVAQRLQKERQTPERSASTPSPTLAAAAEPVGPT